MESIECANFFYIYLQGLEQILDASIKLKNYPVIRIKA